MENKTPAETFPKFPSVLHVIDRSDLPPQTLRSKGEREARATGNELFARSLSLKKKRDVWERGRTDPPSREGGRWEAKHFMGMASQAAKTLFVIYIRDSIALRFEPFKRAYENGSKIALNSTCSKGLK